MMLELYLFMTLAVSFIVLLVVIYTLIWGDDDND